MEKTTVVFEKTLDVFKKHWTFSEKHWTFFLKQRYVFEGCFGWGKYEKTL